MVARHFIGSGASLYEFHDFLPVVRTADGQRARVAMQQWSMGGNLNCDIEVRKMHDRWVPVECRMVSMDQVNGSGGQKEAVGPLYISHR